MIIPMNNDEMLSWVELLQEAYNNNDMKGDDEDE